MHPDLAVARDAVRGTVATFARFSSIAGASLDHLPPRLREVAARLRTHYDMRVHTRAKADHARALEDAFIDWFAIAGPLEIALPRFQRLAALGLDFCHVVPGSGELRRDVAATILQSIATEVLPVLTPRTRQRRAVPSGCGRPAVASTRSTSTSRTSEAAIPAPPAASATTRWWW